MKSRKKVAATRKSGGASKRGFSDYGKLHRGAASSGIVVPVWSVKYDPLGHDMLIEARVKVANPKDCLLQVWLGDHASGIWIPEDQPWVSSVVEFSPDDDVKSAHIGLADSKWRPEDRNVEYVFVLSGYVKRGDTVEKFAFEKSVVYPG